MIVPGSVEESACSYQPHWQPYTEGCCPSSGKLNFDEHCMGPTHQICLSSPENIKMFPNNKAQE